MEIKFALMTLLKIVISTPYFLLLFQVSETAGAALLGEPSNRNSTNTTESYYDYDLMDSQELEDQERDYAKSQSEEIPDPSPLVLPGYNLPENIFNHGKPFYVEKDPLTGKIDFSQKSPSPKLDDDLYDYVDEQPNDNVYDKSNIDRKDGSLSSHRPSDVNQLTPNFHDFLNLPVKYNSAKYVYPLISNSYASTKVQGSVNKFHNHKDYGTKTTTKKPVGSPTYYTTSQYFSPVQTTSRTTITTTTTTTPKPTTEIYLTNKPPNLLSTGMGNQNFMEEFDDYYEMPSITTKKPTPSEVYLTTENANHVYLTTNPTTTIKTPMSLFEQLFGEYDETVKPIKPTTSVAPSLFGNLPSNKYNKYPKTEKPVSSTTTATTTTTSSTTTTTDPNQVHNSHAGPNILTGTSMGLEPNYEYEEYENEKYEDNIAVPTKPVVRVDEDLSIEPLNTNNSEISANNTSEMWLPNNNTDYHNYPEEKITTPISLTTSATQTTSTAATVRVTSLHLGDNHLTTPSRYHLTTSLPLGDNHLTTPSRYHLTTPSHEPFNRDPIIVATQNLREKLNSERVQPKPFQKAPTPPSTTNVHIAHDQDIVSFVVGNQQNVDGGQYAGSSPQGVNGYDRIPFRPLYGQQGGYTDEGNYKIEAEPEASFHLVHPGVPAKLRPEVVGSAVTIQPQKHSEASLAIGIPVNQVPGQVVDEKLDVNNPVEFPQSSTGNKIVFPDDKESEFPDLVPPPIDNDREVLQLSSKPMYHQLPSDLTPPREPEAAPAPRPEQRPVRPPWDPRPGHFYSGKPEYNRPPRPPSDIAYKRIDNLPNILPQFRPNMNKPPGMFYDKRLNRQPLLERPSNRPIGFFERMQPPPPPPPIFLAHKNLHTLRKNVVPPRQSLDDTPIAEDRIMNEGPRKPVQAQDPFGFYQGPPRVKIANRRNGDDDVEVETLQMIQSKNVEKVDDGVVTQVVNIPAEDNPKGNTEKTIYKVYPVNTPPIKMDVIDNNKKESVVIGTRAEPPLPPSRINPDFKYDQNPLFDPKDRHDAPVLKPHPRPQTYPVKSDFPYPLERPDPSINHPAVPETPSKNGNDLDEPDFFSNNQWNSIGDLEPRIVTGHKVESPNQISVTLKTYTEKPIAVAYTPTEPNLNADKYSMPNYGSPVIPEIRFGTMEDAPTGPGGGSKVFTVSATMHTHSHSQPAVVGTVDSVHRLDGDGSANHRLEEDDPTHPQQDFQAPFQASVNVNSAVPQYQGWAVIVKDKNRTTEAPEVTTMPYATTSEFDIENFKPQLEGGFKPIYNFPVDKTSPEVEVKEREE